MIYVYAFSHLCVCMHLYVCVCMSVCVYECAYLRGTRDAQFTVEPLVRKRNVVTLGAAAFKQTLRRGTHLRVCAGVWMDVCESEFDG